MGPQELSYQWGNLEVAESEYEAVVFAYHFAHIVKVNLPDNMGHSISPRSRPLFKISPEIVMDDVFRAWLQRDMLSWLEVEDRGLSVLPWWEIIVKQV